MKRLAAALSLAALLAPVPSSSSVGAPSIMKAESGESVIRVEWQPVPGCAGYNVYLKTQNGQFQRLNRQPVKDSWVRLLGLENGKPYSVAVTAIDQDGTESPAATSRLIAPTGYAYTTLSVKGGSKASDYVLFTVPYRTGRSAQEAFGYLPKYEASKWRLFSLEKDGYHEYADIGSIEPGKAYWFISATKTDLFLSGKTVDGASPFAITLNPGWNLIGSPFLYPVDWSEVLANNPDVAAYVGPAAWEFANGGYEKSGTILPFHGYMVFNAHSGDISLAIPPAPSAPKIYEEDPQPFSAGAMANPGGWMVQLSASDGNYRDQDNYLGILAEADDEPHGLNAAEPPSWPQHLSLYFIRKNETDIRRSTDIRKSAKSWITVIQGGENRQVTLSWKVVAGKPKMTLIDLAKNRRIDMSRQASYVFSRKSTAPRKFIITENSKSGR